MNNTNNTLYGIPPPLGPNIPSCTCACPELACPTLKPCVIFGFKEKIAVMAVGATLFGVLSTMAVIFISTNYKYFKIFPRLKKITAFKLDPIVEEQV